MPLQTVVDAYIRAAVKHAVTELMEDGTVVATVPEAFGVVAFGDDRLECGADLYARLEDWVRVSQARGFTLPPIDGIDLNSADGRALAAYHEAAPARPTGEVFETEAAFTASLDRPGNSAK